MVCDGWFLCLVRGLLVEGLGDQEAGFGCELVLKEVMLTLFLDWVSIQFLRPDLADSSALTHSLDKDDCQM